MTRREVKPGQIFRYTGRFKGLWFWCREGKSAPPLGPEGRPLEISATHPDLGLMDEEVQVWEPANEYGEVCP